MRFGFHLPISGSLLRAVEEARKRRCDALQIFTGNPRSWTRKPLNAREVEEFKASCLAEGLWPVVVHSSYLVNLASPDEEIRRKSIRMVKEDLRRAHLLGAQFVVVHMGHHLGEGEEKGLRRLARSVEGLLKADPQVVLLLENTAGAGTELGYEPSHWAFLAERLPPEGWGICLDLAHAHQAFCDLSSPEGVEEMARRVEEAVGWRKIKLLHLSDSKSLPLSKVDRHEHLGKGTIGRRGLEAIVNHPLLSRLPAILETPTMELKFDRRNLHYARSLVKITSLR